MLLLPIALIAAQVAGLPAKFVFGSGFNRTRTPEKENSIETTTKNARGEYASIEAGSTSIRW